MIYSIATMVSNPAAHNPVQIPPGPLKQSICVKLMLDVPSVCTKKIGLNVIYYKKKKIIGGHFICKIKIMFSLLLIVNGKSSITIGQMIDVY